MIKLLGFNAPERWQLVYTPSIESLVDSETNN